VKRERGPSRLLFDASYIRGTTKEEFPDDGESGSEQITANEVRGWIRQEYDVTERVFGFGSFEAEHDGVEEVSYRLIPKIGAGYKLIDDDTTYFAVDAGPSYVYEKFYDDSINNYFAIAFGAESRVKLPWNGASWFARIDYLPSITDWKNDYRLRGETGILVPLFDPVNFKATLVDEYNSQPFAHSSPTFSRCSACFFRCALNASTVVCISGIERIAFFVFGRSSRHASPKVRGSFSAR
jgi:putative salt-induced outer membrane protein YdiY